jgi:hypothetical protein
MRTLTLFTLLLTLPVLAACGSDGGNKSEKDAGGGDDVAGDDDGDSDGTGDGDGDGDDDGTPQRACEMEPGIDPWGGPQVWTIEQLEDCDTDDKCGGADIMTYEDYANCADTKCAPPAMEYTLPGESTPAGGGSQWVTCLIDSFLSCASKVGGSCRYNWTEYTCCAADNCPNGPASCVETMCADQDGAFIDCVGAALGADPADPCWYDVGQACLVPSMDAGTPDTDAGAGDAGTADAGADGGTSMRVLPAPSARLRARLEKAAFQAARQRGLR